MRAMMTLLAALALLAAGFAHARSAVPLIEHHDLQVVTSSGKELGAAQFRQAVASGVANNRRKWDLKETAEGFQATLSWNHNRHTIVVGIVPNGARYSVRYVSSINMKYEVIDGQAVIHPFYNRYVDELVQSIRAELLKL